MASLSLVLAIASILGFTVDFGAVAPPALLEGMPLLPLAISDLFVAVSLVFALALATKVAIAYPAEPKPIDLAAEEQCADASAGAKPPLDANAILISEFEYARETAYQAMEERRTLINFYLLTIGGAASAVVAFLPAISRESGLLISGVLLLWAASIVGWLTFFQLIALRVAWMGSANAMNFIKEFYKTNAGIMSSKALDSALAFKSATLPAPAKHWNAGHYSAVVVSFLDAVVFGGGALLLVLALASEITVVSAGVVAILSCSFFFGHYWTYDIYLMYSKAPKR